MYTFVLLLAVAHARVVQQDDAAAARLLPRLLAERADALQVAQPARPTRRELLGAAAAVGAGVLGPSAAQAEDAEPAAAPAPAADVDPPSAVERAVAAVKREPVKQTLPSGLSYTVKKEGGKSLPPVVGDLIAIRFKTVVRVGPEFKGNPVLDDILANPEPYYYRVGSGQVLPAVEQAVVKMRAGDIWEMEVPSSLGFGEKGRQASAGKPRVPGNAILDVTLELVAVPGKDEEIIDANGVTEEGFDKIGR